jgi:hypothetical protein
MSDWRLAKSLIVLTSEIEYAYPDTTVWDIGDAAHQDDWSDHNPNVCCDVVCGVDVLPDHGLSLPKFVAHLLADPHPNLRYVIYDGYIYQRKNGFRPQVYTGPNKHKKHAHVSVGNGPDGRSTSNYDSTATWDIDHIDDAPATPPKPSKPSKPSTGTKLGDKMPTIQRGNKGSRVRMLQGLLIAWGYKLAVDGVFGKNTDAALRDFQRKYAKPVDGVAGPITWNALLGIK